MEVEAVAAVAFLRSVRGKARADGAAGAAVRRVSTAQELVVAIVVFKRIDNVCRERDLGHVVEDAQAVDRFAIEQEVDIADRLADFFEEVAGDGGGKGTVGRLRSSLFLDDFACGVCKAERGLLVRSSRFCRDFGRGRDARIRARRGQVAVGGGSGDGLDVELLPVGHLPRKDGARVIVEAREAVDHLVAALLVHHVGLVEDIFIEVRPCREIRELVRGKHIECFGEPVLALRARAAERILAAEDARLGDRRDLSVFRGERLHDVHVLREVLHPVVLRLRLFLIHVEARHVDERIAGIARQIVIFVRERAVRRVDIEEVVHALFVAQVFFRVAEEVLELARRAVRRAPPEPAAVVLVIGTEQHGDVLFLQGEAIGCNLVEVGSEDRVEVAAGQHAPHDIAIRHDGCET